jgi:hypothetical protein
MERRLVYVDRIEGDIAILAEEEKHAPVREVRKKNLPRGTQEGDWLSEFGEPNTDGVRYEKDEAATAAAKAEVQSLMDELRNRPKAT